MGLDIMYLNNVKLPDELLGLGPELFEEFTFGVDDEFRDRCHSFPLVNGKGIVYLTAESRQGGFRAGSYGGYNQFRNILCQAIHGISCDAFWNGRRWDEEEFGALIDFSDCEGSMCYSIADELNRSFNRNRPKFKKYLKSPEAGLDEFDILHFLEKYDDWTEATGIAKEKGLILFC